MPLYKIPLHTLQMASTHPPVSGGLHWHTSQGFPHLHVHSSHTHKNCMSKLYGLKCSVQWHNSKHAFNVVCPTCCTHAAKWTAQMLLIQALRTAWAVTSLQMHTAYPAGTPLFVYMLYSL